MAVTKVKWKSGGQERTAWASTFYDDNGERHRKQGFQTKKEAEKWEQKERERLGQFTQSASVMRVKDLCKEWLDVTGQGLGERPAVERTSWNDYELSVRLHINPHIGDKLLSDITTPDIVNLRKTLLGKSSRDKTRRVLKHLRQAMTYGVQAGHLTFNPAENVRVADDNRSDDKIVIPSRSEMLSILEYVDKRAEHELANPKRKLRSWIRFAAMIRVLIGAGLRISETRGLSWFDLDLENGEIIVRQRADRYGNIGRLKSKAAYRKVMIGPSAIKWLNIWKPLCYACDLHLVFPSKEGKVEAYRHIMADYWQPTLKEVGLVDDEGNTKYTIHQMRHFCVSQKIAADANVREIMDEIGHASSAMTLDLYGHLFPEDDAKRKEQARKIDLEIWSENGQKANQDIDKLE